MYARVTRLKGNLDKIDESIRQYREETVPTIEKLGSKGAYLLINRENGEMISITLWDTDLAMQNSERQANRLRTSAAQTSSAAQPPEVERYEVAVQPAKLAEYGL